MNNGKYARQPRRRRRSNRKKASFLLTSLILLLTLVIGGTAAFLIAYDDPVENTFKPSRVATEVHETFSNNVKEKVKIYNSGDTTAYIRAAIVVTWKDGKGGNVYPGTPTGYTMLLNLTDWDEGPDGFYYYKYPVEPGQETNPLIISCTPGTYEPEGYALNVEILGSAIQSVPTSVVTSNWGVTVNSDGTISK